MTNERSKTKPNVLGGSNTQVPITLASRNAIVTPPRDPKPTRLYRPAFRVSANCGCGARFSDLEDGYQHSKTTGHTLSVTGEIRASL